MSRQWPRQPGQGRQDSPRAAGPGAGSPSDRRRRHQCRHCQRGGGGPHRRKVFSEVRPVRPLKRERARPRMHRHDTKQPGLVLRGAEIVGVALQRTIASKRRSNPGGSAERRPRPGCESPLLRPVRALVLMSPGCRPGPVPHRGRHASVSLSMRRMCQARRESNYVPWPEARRPSAQHHPSKTSHIPVSCTAVSAASIPGVSIRPPFFRTERDELLAASTSSA